MCVTVQCCVVSKPHCQHVKRCVIATLAPLGFSLLASTPASHVCGCEFESGAGLCLTTQCRLHVCPCRGDSEVMLRDYQYVHIVISIYDAIHPYMCVLL